jgi:C1A family cysteine protease
MKLFNHKSDKHLDTDWAEKDWGFDRIRSTLTQASGDWEMHSEHIIPEYTPISNQGKAGSCVANAWCDMLEILAGLDDPGKVKQLSRRFLYWCARYLTGDASKDKGTYLRSAAHQLRKIGIVEEEYFEYSDRQGAILASPELDLYTMASNNKLEGFYRITSEGEQRLKEIEIAIRSDHPVVFGTPVTRKFQQYRGGGNTFNLESSDQVGRHAMMWVGVAYNPDKSRKFLTRNSWSKNWGNDGHCWMSEQYVASSKTRDIWVGTYMPAII